MTKYEAVIGLEIHTQLKTKSKIFCSCSTEFGNQPNANICPVCSGQPGALPVLNKEVVELAIRCGLALNCQINPKSIFARKNYFYPDLPKGYQISQFDQPVCLNGTLEVTLDDGTVKKIGITRAHLEEDAGKLVHQGSDSIEGAHSSYVDLNRSSVPLLEIVSEPDIRSAEEARKYLEKIKAILRYAGVSDADMEEGKLRCDANVSLRPIGETKFGTKTEVKNMNSFRGVERAIKSEIRRQEKILTEGGRIIQETRNYDDNTGETTPLRSKEESHDYRYFPEPDLLPLVIDQVWVEKVRKELPELPEQRIKRYIQEYGMSEYDAGVMILDKDISDFFDNAAKIYTGDKKIIANWISSDILGYLKDNNKSITQTRLTAELLVEMLKLIDDKTISGKIGKDILKKIMETGKSPKAIVEESGLKQITDTGALEKIIQEVLAENPKQVEQYKAGKTAVRGHFVGQVMKKTQGKANPGLVNQLLDRLLS
jgi:aspartyl-tRNA(Asn)/glutamyl-tRNA(Gln) amidotransferase subunit B